MNEHDLDELTRKARLNRDLYQLALENKLTRRQLDAGAVVGIGS